MPDPTPYDYPGESAGYPPPAAPTSDRVIQVPINEATVVRIMNAIAESQPWRKGLDEHTARAVLAALTGVPHDV